MDSDNPTLKWSLAGVGVVVVCFCLGYFVFGTKGPSEPVTTVQATPSPAATPGSLQVTSVDNQPLHVEDITAEKEAERKRKEAVEKAKLEAKLKEEAAKAAATPVPDETTSSNEEPVNTDEENTKPATDVEKPATDVEKPATDVDKPKTDVEKPKTDVEKPKAVAEKEPSSKSLYRVRVGGAKSSREDAERLVAELRGRGYTPSIIADQRKGKTVFHVQAGAFSDADGAERRKKELENNGYDARIN